jgi:ABC-2 type transport system ATP-binding protein
VDTVHIHSTPLLVEQLAKSYGGRVVLVDVDLDVRPGEIVGLLGRNGAGKTTLMSIIAGLVRPSHGRVLIGGIDVTRKPRAAQRLLGLAPQEVGVYPNATVRENLRLFGALQGVYGRALRRAIADVAAGMAIEDLIEERAGTLSGGQQRRLHTAAALLHHPPLLLLDEPTVGADIATRATVLETVRARAAAGAAVLYSTHYLRELDELDASLAVLNHGRILARGTRKELLAKVGKPAVRFIFPSAAPRVEGTAIDGSMLVARGSDAAATAALILRGLGEAAASLQSIEIVEPSLDDVFAAYAAHDDDRPQVRDVA